MMKVVIFNGFMAFIVGMTLGAFGYSATTPMFWVAMIPVAAVLSVISTIYLQKNK